MTDATHILGDAEWLAHRYDASNDRIQFCRVDRAGRAALTFLAEYQPAQGSDVRWIGGAEVRAATIETAPVNYVFHSAFSRSTLLAKIFNIPGIAMGYSEPAIINDLAALHQQAPDRAAAMTGPVLDLLARPMGDGEAVIIKPSNMDNRLLPLLLSANSDAKAILNFSPLPRFLASIAKKGIEGRIWGRKLYLHNSEYAPINLGLDSRAMFALSDLQVAALAWLTHQRHFAGLLDSREFSPRLATLDGETFNAQKARTICESGQFFGLDIDRKTAQDIADGPLFSRHAKLGTDFAETMAEEEKAASSAINDEEIAIIERWIAAIAEQFGSPVPVSKPLFSA